MAKDCCSAKEEALNQLRVRQAKVLKIVLLLNALMFFIEFAAGILARSTALLADSLDMFGDAMVYGFSLYVLNKSLKWRASAALLKGLLMVAFAAGVLAEALCKITHNLSPEGLTMGLIGGLALVVNLICLVLLTRHKEDDINMKSTWICSRNDIIANTSVIAASGLVLLTNSHLPDLLIGTAIALLFARSALLIIFEAKDEFAAANNREQKSR